MTEPTGPTEPQPPASAPPPEPAIGWAPPTAEPGPGVAQGWVSPDQTAGPSGRRRGCILGCVIVAVALPAVLLVAVIGLIFLGGQIQGILRGTVQFGTGGEGCNITGTANSFSASVDVHFVAYLEETVDAGDAITFVETFPDGTVSRTDQDVTEDGITCVYGDYETDRPAGTYAMEITMGSTSLAKGSFESTP